MNPQFQLGRWEERVLSIADNTVDLVYTDPPYGMGYMSNIPGCKHWNKTGESKSKFDKPILNDTHGDIDFSNFAKQMYRVMKHDSFIFIHCNVEWIGINVRCFKEAGFKEQGTVAWNKRFSIGGNLTGAMKRDWEPIWYLSKGKPKMRPIIVDRLDGRFERKRISEIADWVFTLKASDKTGFPTQKPKELCRQVILLTTDKGSLVLDPFAGSGTIGKMAASLDRESISFEADEGVYSKFLEVKTEECVGINEQSQTATC
jgi:DNA modification methylase